MATEKCVVYGCLSLGKTPGKPLYRSNTRETTLLQIVLVIG